MAEAEKKPGLSRWGAGAIMVMLGFLVWAGWYAVESWNAMAGVSISPLGWFFMILAVFVTFGLGAGLMLLVFYSSRHDMDR